MSRWGWSGIDEFSSIAVKVSGIISQDGMQAKDNAHIMAKADSCKSFREKRKPAQGAFLQKHFHVSL
jgi:hypothetical protein